MDSLYEIISENLVELRKQKGLTQAEFAEKIKYSDKSVSKWETGMSIPSVDTLLEIANFYNVKLDDLVKPSAVSKESEEVREEAKIYKKNSRLFVWLLSIAFIWLLVTCIYTFEYIQTGSRDWRAFIWGIPASCAISIVYSMIWKRNLSFIFTSLFSWTLITAIFLEARSPQFYLLFILGVPIQIIIILFKGLVDDAFKAKLLTLFIKKRQQKKTKEKSK